MNVVPSRLRLLLWMLALATTVNLWFHTQPPEPKHATDISPGTQVDVPAVLVDRAPCTVVVAFDATCEFCRAARDYERRTRETTTVWLTTRETPGNADFDRVVVDSAAYAALRVHGVPWAFAIDSGGVVRSLSGYDGITQPRCDV